MCIKARTKMQNTMELKDAIPKTISPELRALLDQSHLILITTPGLNSIAADQSTTGYTRRITPTSCR